MIVEILLAEDYADFAEVVTAAFELRGLPIAKVATTGSEAIAAINLGFDAVITDYDLGMGPTGADVARAAVVAGVPFVVLWSSVSRDYALRGDPLMDEPTFHLMEKPWAGERVDPISKIASLLTDGSS